MKNYQRRTALVLTAIALAASTLVASCGGSDSTTATDTDTDTDTSVVVPAVISIKITTGDMAATDPALLKVTSDLAITAGALVQAILAVNTFAFTDIKTTDFATYLQRKASANQALGILNVYAQQTEQSANAMVATAARPAVLVSPHASLTAATDAVSPQEVLAVLNSSKSRWPIITLMQQYQVSAKRAQLILNNAMNGLTSEAYLDQAAIETQRITQAALVRDASGLVVTVGSTLLTAGAAGGVMTVFETGSALISTADAVIKVTKSGAELAIGRDGALDDVFEKSTLVRTIAGVSEVVSINGLFSKSLTLLDTTNKLTYVTGKVSELFQENKVSFGAETLTLTKFDEDFKTAYLARVKALNYPYTYPGSYVDADNKPVVVSATQLPQVVLDALDKLPIESQLAIVQQILPDTPDVPIMNGGISLVAERQSADESSVTYSVSATLQDIKALTSVVLGVTNASVVGASKSLSGNGTLTWSVTVLGQSGTVTVTRGDTGASVSTSLAGVMMNFDGTYRGVAVTDKTTSSFFCWDSTPVSVTVAGSVLSGDVIGSLTGNSVSGTYPSQGLTFTGRISGNTMSGTWDDPAGGCNGTFSISK